MKCENKGDNPMKKIIGYFVILLAVIEMTACGASDQNLSSPTAIPLPKIFVAEGHLVPQNKLMLTFTVRGKVSEILVSKGQKVTAGQVLIRLADQEQAQASLAGAQLEQVQARQVYDTFLRTSNLANAQACLHKNPASACSC
jgi:multidrug efflux pump subunit AcrA (membrane-fusion protein)